MQQPGVEKIDMRWTVNARWRFANMRTEHFSGPINVKFRKEPTIEEIRERLHSKIMVIVGPHAKYVLYDVIVRVVVTVTIRTEPVEIDGKI